MINYFSIGKTKTKKNTLPPIVKERDVLWFQLWFSYGNPTTYKTKVARNHPPTILK